MPPAQRRSINCRKHTRQNDAGEWLLPPVAHRPAGATGPFANRTYVWNPYSGYYVKADGPTGITLTHYWKCRKVGRQYEVRAKPYYYMESKSLRNNKCRKPDPKARADGTCTAGTVPSIWSNRCVTPRGYGIQVRRVLRGY